MTPSPSSSPATDFAVALLDEFVSLGLRNVVLSPGSRSQALALAAAEFERAGLIDLRVRIDERVAGFLALGLAIESSTPSLVIATSGTAIANLHPAVLEAHHAGVPLIIASADRPEALRGIGSNQTTQQSGIFGAAIDRSWDVGAPTGEDGEADAAAAVARDASTIRGTSIGTVSGDGSSTKAGGAPSNTAWSIDTDWARTTPRRIGKLSVAASPPSRARVSALTPRASPVIQVAPVGPLSRVVVEPSRLTVTRPLTATFMARSPASSISTIAKCSSP